MYDDHVFCNDALNEIKFHLSSIFRAQEFIDRFSKSADMAHILKLSKESMEISKSYILRKCNRFPQLVNFLPDWFLNDIDALAAWGDYGE